MRVSSLWVSGALALLVIACGDDENTNGGDTAETADADAANADTTGAGADSAAGTDATGDPDGTDEIGATDGDDAVAGCGDVTWLGGCDGSTLQYCACEDPSDDAGCRANGELMTVNCAETLAPPLNGRCVFVSDDYGFDCAVAPGDPCTTPDGLRLCDGTEPGCVVTSPPSGVCTEGVGVCDEAAFEPTCLGDRLAIACQVAQPVAFDCAAWGGTCDDDDDDCVGLGADAPCGALDDTRLRCGDGLECVGASLAGLGRCTESGDGD